MQADLIFAGGTVLTVNPDDYVASAVAVVGDRIVYVGTEEEALAWKGPDTLVVQLDGRTLLPGLIEAHCHIMGWGSAISGLDLTGAASIGEIKELVRKRSEDLDAGCWIRGRGYNQLHLAEGRHPDRWDLDEVSKDHPVVLTRCCGHIGVVNSRALNEAGLTDDSLDLPGGVMDRDEDGRLTGVLRETARDPVKEVSSPPSVQLREWYAAGCADLVRWGITSAHDMGREGTTCDIAGWHSSEKIPLRVFATVPPEEMDEVWSGGGHLRFLQGNRYFRTGHMKLFADGSSSGPTAATREPYASDPADCGIQVTSQKEIIDIFLRANRLGFSLTAHAVGDRGIEMVLNGQEAALGDRPRRGVRPGYSRVPRHRIEHCAMAFSDLRQRIKDMSIIPVGQTIFLHDYGDNYAGDYGVARARSMFPMRSLLDAGIPVALSSDAPVSHPNPLAGMAAACSRKSRGGEVLGGKERISLTDALRCYTMHGAYAEFAEDIKGSIEVGKLADFAVVDAPLLELGGDELVDCSVDMTVIAGEVVYDSHD